MIDAPFTGSAAASALGALAVILIALGGLLVMVRTGWSYAGRALALGVTVALMAGLAGHVFQ